jgi:hypothetical protein
MEFVQGTLTGLPLAIFHIESPNWSLNFTLELSVLAVLDWYRCWKNKLRNVEQKVKDIWSEQLFSYQDLSLEHKNTPLIPKRFQNRRYLNTNYIIYVKNQEL